MKTMRYHETLVCEKIADRFVVKHRRRRFRAGVELARKLGLVAIHGHVVIDDRADDVGAVYYTDPTGRVVDPVGA